MDSYTFHTWFNNFRTVHYRNQMVPDRRPGVGGPRNQKIIESPLSYSVRLKSFEKARHPKSSHPVEIVNAHGLNGSTKTLLIAIKVRTNLKNQFRILIVNSRWFQQFMKNCILVVHLCAFILHFHFDHYIKKWNCQNVSRIDVSNKNSWNRHRMHLSFESKIMVSYFLKPIHNI